MRPIGTSRTRVRSSPGRKVATLRYLENGLMMELDAPYDKVFMASFKASIPSKKRIWDNNDKVWYVVRDQFEKLTYILDEHYAETLLLDFPKQDVSVDAWSKLWLLPNAPIEVVRAVYRALSLKYHPDRGGDAEAMTVINGAYKEILGEFTNGD